MRALSTLLLALAFVFALAQDGGALRTASYGLFPVEGSGVSGQVQIAERLEGGVHVTITLVGIEQGAMYTPAIYRGDCGPDREHVLTLPPVGSFVNDPFSSLSDQAASFDDLTEGDYFMYVFDGEVTPPGQDGAETGGARVVACGEVGAGANR